MTTHSIVGYRYLIKKQSIRKYPEKRVQPLFLLQDVFVVPLLDDSLFSSWQEYVKYLRSYDEYHIQYDLHNAIDLKNESYGLIFVEDHYFLGKIIADEHGYRLAQSDLDPSTSLFKVLDVSREKLHLFVK